MKLWVKIAHTATLSLQAVNKFAIIGSSSSTLVDGTRSYRQRNRSDVLGLGIARNHHVNLVRTSCLPNRNLLWGAERGRICSISPSSVVERNYSNCRPHRLSTCGREHMSHLVVTRSQCSFLARRRDTPIRSCCSRRGGPGLRAVCTTPSAVRLMASAGQLLGEAWAVSQCMQTTGLQTKRAIDDLKMNHRLWLSHSLTAP